MNMPNDNNDAAKKPGILDMAVNQETFKVIFDWKDRIERIFTILPFQDFIPIWLLYERSLHTSQDKVYLREMSEVLNMPMRRVSALARSMQDRGLVDWKHDGSGEDGTYLQIHEDVLNSVLMQKNLLNDLLERVINTFGKEELFMLILTLSRIEKIIDKELKEE